MGYASIKNLEEFKSLTVNTDQFTPLINSGDLITIDPFAELLIGSKVLIHTYNGELFIGHLLASRKDDIRIQLLMSDEMVNIPDEKIELGGVITEISFK